MMIEDKAISLNNCKTCIHNNEEWDSDNCDGCCENHSNYNRAISLNAVLKALEIYEYEEFYSVLKRVFTELPSVTPQTGHWIDDIARWKCSECDWWYRDWKQFNYCPNCGAKMVESQKRSEEV